MSRSMYHHTSTALSALLHSRCGRRSALDRAGRCADKAHLDTVPRGGSAARGVDREVPTKGSSVRAGAEETGGEARGAPLPPGGRPALCKNAKSAVHAVTATWFGGLCSRRYWS
jgi:hypothetical protein